MSARFIERLLVSPQVDQQTREALKQATVIVGDNVGDYYYMGTGQEIWRPERDFPNVAPPFESFFIEFRAPTHIYSDEVGRVEWGRGEERPIAWGVLFGAVDTLAATEASSPEALVQQLIAAESLLEVLSEYYWAFARPALQRVGGDRARARALFTEQQRAVVDTIASLYTQIALMRRGAWGEARAAWRQLAAQAGGLAVRWVVFAQIFTEFLLGSQRAAFSPWYWTLPVSPEGKILASDDRALFISGPLEAIEREMRCLAREKGVDLAQLTREHSAEIHPLFYPALLTITFLHCANVTRTRVDPPARELSARARRHGSLPHRRMPYYVLNIEPLKTILRCEGRSEQQGLRRALHVCRGHFADYRAGAGLFGKHKGIFWFPQHLRGRPSPL